MALPLCPFCFSPFCPLSLSKAQSSGSWGMYWLSLMHVLSFARVFIYSLVYFIQILIFLLSEGSIMLYASLVFALVIKIYILVCALFSQVRWWMALDVKRLEVQESKLSCMSLGIDWYSKKMVYVHSDQLPHQQHLQCKDIFLDIICQLFTWFWIYICVCIPSDTGKDILKKYPWLCNALYQTRLAS